MKKYLRTSILALVLLLPTLSMAQDFFDDRMKSDLALKLVMQSLKLDGTPQAITLKSQKTLSPLGATDQARVISSMRFETATLDDIQIVVNSPRPLKDIVNPLPVLFLIAGLQTDADAVSLIQNPGEMIIVGFIYPITLDLITKDPKMLAQALQKTPGQIATALAWVSEQAWTSLHHFGVCGISLGSLFLPVSLRIAEAQGTIVPAKILAYGGADIGLVIQNELKDKWGASQINDAANAARIVLFPLEPKLHLPFLRGRFLLIRASSDEVFPEASSALLESITPSPKSLVVVPGPHINVDKREMIDQTAAAIRAWL